MTWWSGGSAALSKGLSKKIDFFGQTGVFRSDAFGIVSPDADGDTAPFCEDSGMVLLLLGESAYFVGEGEGFGEIAELENAL